MKRTITLSVDEEVWRKFRSKCIELGVSASSMVELFMKEFMQKWAAAEQEKRKTKK